jgi:hypothetical protein
MTEETIEVGVVLGRIALRGPWASHAWLPRAVLPATPAIAPWTRIGTEAGEADFYAGCAKLALRSGDTAHYRDNLASGRPSLWVALRPVSADLCEVAMVTADPYEGEALAGGMEEIVEAVPMPLIIQQKLATFVAAFHVEHEFVKRQREHADPEMLTRRGGVARRDDFEPGGRT